VSRNQTPFQAENSRKRAGLRRMQAIATALLAATAALYATATALGARHPGGAWSYVAAFAEAATVGAIADWFAVVALFRHPLGLTFIPHTAIIPKNKSRIAENLGNFVHAEFFSAERVSSALAALDPASKISSWLCRPGNAEKIGDIASRIFSYTLNALDEKTVRTYFRKVVRDRIMDFDLAHLAGEILGHLTEDRRHQELLNQLLEKLSELVNKPETQALLESAIAERLPLYFEALKQRGATAAAVAIVKIFAKILTEVDQNPDHPIRHAFDEKLATFIAALQTDPAYGFKLEELKRAIIRNPLLTSYLDGILQDIRGAVERDLNAPHSRIRMQIVLLARDLGRELAADERMRTWINSEILSAAPRLIEHYGPALGRFISEKMKSWKDEEIVQKMELNIGRDLQFIRINGTLVGGMAGLAIHAATLVLT
jgi:uncharacterized membrane-anchored protein YjiN (DUF445 family)